VSATASIITALVAALGMALMAFRGERNRRADAENKAAALKANAESAQQTAEHLGKVAKAREARLTDVMAEHNKALGKIEKSRIEIEEVKDEPEKIAGLWNKWMKKRGE
jgi:flagellar biosynthesis/type III secretory pathway M-ring protein FliF/YscJ